VLAFQVDIPAMGWAGVVYTPDGRRFATGGPDGAVRVWDFDTLKETLVCRGQAGAVNAVTFSADGRRLAAATSSGTVLIWDARDGE
jgi:WD40 repeat protein